MVERSRRSKLIETFWLFWAFNHRGIHNAVLGPTILDIQLLLQKNLDALSYLFFANGLGSMLGSLAAGFLAPRFDIRLQLFLTLAVGVISISCLAQVHHLAYMYIMVLIFGLTRGLAVCYVMTLAGELWEKKGPPFHFVACGTSVGAILAPLISKPFLCPYDMAMDREPVNITAVENPPNATHLISMLEIELVTCTFEDTRVQWAFFFLGLYMLPACLAQLYYWLSYRSDRSKDDGKGDGYMELKQEQVLRFNPIFVLFFFTLFVMYVLLSSLPATYSNILTVYGVRGPLGMSKDDMVTMTSVFWFGSLISRFSNGFYTRYFTNFQVLVVHICGLAISGILFLTLGNRYPEALWVVTVLVGYFGAPYLAGVLAWVSDILELHPKITSLCFLASGAGNMVFPFLGGILFDYYGAMSYLYLIFTIVVLMCLVFTSLKALSKILPLQKEEECAREMLQSD